MFLCAVTFHNDFATQFKFEKRFSLIISCSLGTISLDFMVAKALNNSKNITCFHHFFFFQTISRQQVLERIHEPKTFSATCYLNLIFEFFPHKYRAGCMLAHLRKKSCLLWNCFAYIYF